MKKSMLLVGAFLTVAAMAQAKEVVPAPVVVEEAPVQIVEKEVIVYRDKEEGFRPNGYVDLQYRYYGDTEGDEKASGWNPNNNYSRIQLQGNINMTENQSLEYRIRSYNSLDEESEVAGSKSNGTETRLRYFYDHGYLGDSKVDLTSRLHYQNDAADDYQNVEYQARFDFADYMFNNNFVKTDYFVLAPKYGYAWGDDNSSDYDNRLGVDLYTWHTLPWNFSVEFNLYTTQHFYGQDHYFDGMRDKDDKEFTVDMEFYIYNTTNLYTNGRFSVDFGFEGGYDDYNWSNKEQWGTKINASGRVIKDENGEEILAGTDDTNYELYALPYLQVNYAVSENMTVYAAAGAEYRDWAVNNGKSASNWRWQPTAWAGFKATF